MNMRLGALLPRAVLIALAWILATAAFTLAADKTNIIGQQPATTATGPAAPPSLTVPDVSGQAFVFAKGLLEDAGFAWHVTGSVHGYAGNQVVGQSPAAGTQVVDTGAPTVVVTLVKGRYGEQGVPQDTSSYRGTAIKLANKPAAPAAHPAAKAKPPAAKAKPPAEKARPALRSPACAAKRDDRRHAPRRAGLHARRDADRDGDHGPRHDGADHRLHLGVEIGDRHEPAVPGPADREGRPRQAPPRGALRAR